MASNIYLYNIPGISRTDEPMFSTKEMRDLYFSTKSHWSPTDGFFVPHFKDALEFDTSDLSFNSNCNYVRISFLNRDYFYFIDSVEYVSEDVIRIYITMDVIQTYAYDLEFYKYERTRKLITRWIDGKANRAYLRENVSQGIFQVTSVKYYNTPSEFSVEPRDNDYTTGTIVFKIKPGDGSKVANQFIYNFGTAFETVGSYHYFFLPMFQGNLREGRVDYYASDGTTRLFQSKDADAFAYYIRNEALVEDVYYLPLSPLYVLATGANTSKIDSSTYEKREDVAETALVKLIDGQFGGVKIFKDNYTLPFVTSNSPTDAFTPYSVPAMLDENYMRVEFGEGSTLSSYPLYQTITPTLQNIYIPDVIDGSRIYSITSEHTITSISLTTEYNVPLKDPYGVTVRATNPLRFDIFTDAYKQWFTFNKGALIGSIVQTAGGMGMAASSGYFMNDAISDYSSVAYINARTKADRRRVVQNENYRRSLNSINTGKQLGGSANSLVNWAQEGLNASFSPDLPKQTGNVNSDRLVNAATILMRISMVNDFDECARYFETNGYKVHEINKNTSSSGSANTPSPWLRTRYFYDVVSIDNIAYRLLNAPLSEEVDEELRARFANGFRAWHGYEYQGRSYLYIEAENLILGSTCIYDNTEVS